MNIATAPARSASPSVFPTSRAYLWLAGIYLMLAVYGSLVPFQFRWLAWDEVLQQSQQLRLAHLRIQSRTDFVANVLLFIPLAFLVMGAVCVDRPPGRAIVAGLILVPLCAALSGGIEFVQIYFPPRTPSASDIVAESLGGALGVLLWLTAGRRITGWARQVWSSRHGRDLASLILPVYLAFLVLINVLPLDLTLSPADIYRKYREGRLTLVPFASFCANHSLMLGKALWNLLWFLPIGALLASLPAFSWEDRRNWLRVWGLGLVVATLIESMQLFVVTRFVDVTDIVVESLGVLAGWSAVRCYQQLKIRSRLRFLSEPRGLRWIFVVWLGLVVFLTWRPFDFQLDSAFIADRWSRFSLVPFADYWQGTEYNAFDQFLHKLLLYLPLGLLLGSWARFAKGTHAGLLTVVASLCLASLLELGQFCLPDRQASLTDVLVEAGGAWLGFFGLRKWREQSSLARDRTGN
ncbi:MAG: VanZ family protein [Planctomycetes bacterium]|nr:VanZ family protein [Planctomycetota bacterium]